MKNTSFVYRWFWQICDTFCAYCTFHAISKNIEIHLFVVKAYITNIKNIYRHSTFGYFKKRITVYDIPQIRSLSPNSPHVLPIFTLVQRKSLYGEKIMQHRKRLFNTFIKLIIPEWKYMVIAGKWYQRSLSYGCRLVGGIMNVLKGSIFSRHKVYPFDLKCTCGVDALTIHLFLFQPPTFLASLCVYMWTVKETCSYNI